MDIQEELIQINRSPKLPNGVLQNEEDLENLGVTRSMKEWRK